MSTPGGTPRPLVFWVFMALATFLSLQALTRVLVVEQREPIDFGVFYAAGEVVAEGLSPYRGDPVLGRRYHYPQAWAQIMAPVTALDRDTATRLWMGLNLLVSVGFVAILIRWSVRYLRAEGLPTLHPVAIGVLFLMGIGYSPLLFGYRLGQLDILLCAMLSLMFVVPRRHLPLVAGVVLGVATVIKMSPLLLLPALALAFGWRFVFGVGGVMLLYISILIMSGLFPEELYFLTDQMPFHQFRTSYPASSLHALFGVYLFPETFIHGDYYKGWMTTLVTCVALGAYAVAGLYAWWRRAGWLALLAIGVCFAHMASPFLEPHHHTTSLLVLIPWLAIFAVRHDTVPLVLAGAAWLVGGMYLNLSEGFSGWPPFYLIVGDVLILVVALLRPELGGESPWLLERNRFPPPRN